MREIHLACSWPRLARFIRRATFWMDEEAITLGPFVFYLVPDPAPDLRAHEGHHVVHQRALWWIGYWVAYPLLFAWSAMVSAPGYFALWMAGAYWNHPFERAARKAAGQE